MSNLKVLRNNAQRKSKEVIGKSAKEVLKRSGLDWKVKKEILKIGDNPTQYFGLVKEGSTKPFGVCTKTYGVLQNEQCFGIIDKLIPLGFEPKYTSETEKGFVMVQGTIQGNSAEIVDGDKVEQHITIYNNHNGKGSAGFLITNKRLVCNNQLNSMIPHIRVSHNTFVEHNYDEASKIIDIACKRFVGDIEIFKKLAEKKFKGNIDLFLQKIIPPTKGENAEKNLQKKIDQIKENFKKGIGQDIDGVQGTNWAMYNAITEYTTHQTRETKGKEHSLLRGELSRVNKKALELLVA